MLYPVFSVQSFLERLYWFSGKGEGDLRGDLLGRMRDEGWRMNDEGRRVEDERRRTIDGGRTNCREQGKSRRYKNSGAIRIAAQ